MYILSFDFSQFLPIFPIIFLVVLMFALHKKRMLDQERNRGKGYGRKGRKDHLWLIIKDYLKQMGEIGVSIETPYIFDRPESKDLHTFLKKGFIFRCKQEAKERNEKYKKPLIPERFELEDYFERLEAETANSNEEYLCPCPNNQKVQFSKKHKLLRQVSRKRYVILFKTKSKSDNLSDWRALDVEVVKKPTKEGKNKDTILVNSEVDAEKELTWVLPLLHQKLSEQEKANRKKK